MLQRVFILFLFIHGGMPLLAQNQWTLFDHAMKEFMTDSQCTHAVISFCAIHTKNGQVWFQLNSDEKLPPASTIKTFTTAASYEILKPDFTYTTDITFRGTIEDSIAYGELLISGNGDPTFGSDRFPETTAPRILTELDEALKRHGIRAFQGHVVFLDTLPHDSASSSFWLEEDYGNYYGTGVHSFNWKENKLDITLTPFHSSFRVEENNGGLNNERDFCMELVQKEGSGTEDAFAYIAHHDTCKYVLKGFLTATRGPQTLSLAAMDPSRYFIYDLKRYFGSRFKEIDLRIKKIKEIHLITFHSPPMKDMIYACNQKSLNLYAETFCKSMGYRKMGRRSWKDGIRVMSDFASSLKVDAKQISLKDGSGLSPQNTITTRTMATLLYRYKSKGWWPLFYESLPLINELHMKSGYIGGTRSYTGYLNLSSGEEISFAFIVHGYEGSPKRVREKMFKVLDTLKP